MLRNNNGDVILPYRQVTKLQNRNSCKLTFPPSDIKSLYFNFDNCNNVIPGQLQVYDGMFFTDYCDIKIVKITDDYSMNDKYDSENDIYYRYYASEYVEKNYSYSLKGSKKLKDLVGCYFIDWNGNENVTKMITESCSEYIELNYYIFA